MSYSKYLSTLLTSFLILGAGCSSDAPKSSSSQKNSQTPDYGFQNLQCHPGQTPALRQKGQFFLPFGSYLITSSWVSPHDGKVAFATNRGEIFILDPKGQVLSQFEIRDHIRVAPVITPDGSVVVLSDYFAYFFSTNGKLLRKIETPWAATVRSNPQVLKNGTVVVGAYDGRVYFLDKNGTRSHFERALTDHYGSSYSEPYVLSDDSIMLVVSQTPVYGQNPLSLPSEIPGDVHLVLLPADGRRAIGFDVNLGAQTGTYSAVALPNSRFVIGFHDTYSDFFLLKFFSKKGFERELRVNRIGPNPQLKALSDNTVVIFDSNAVTYIRPDGQQQSYELALRYDPKELLPSGHLLYMNGHNYRQFWSQNIGNSYKNYYPERELCAGSPIIHSYWDLLQNESNPYFCKNGQNINRRTGFSKNDSQYGYQFGNFYSDPQRQKLLSSMDWGRYGVKNLTFFSPNSQDYNLYDAQIGQNVTDIQWGGKNTIVVTTAAPEGLIFFDLGCSN